MNLPADISDFFHWWFVKSPKRLIEISRNAVILVNNELSFALNLRMFFVPLFGDYTWIGRVMGFAYRIFKIIVGFILVTTLLIFVFALNIFYLVLPLTLLYFLNIYFVPLIVLFFALWKIASRNVASRKVYEVEPSKYKKSLKQRTKHYTRMFEKIGSKTLDQFLEEDDIHNLLARLELLETDFPSHLKGMSVSHKDLEKKAFNFAKKQKALFVELEHLFFVYLEGIEKVEVFLSAYSLELDTVENCIKWIVSHKDSYFGIKFWQEEYEVPVIGGVNRALTGRVTPFLDKFSLDLTMVAAQGKYKNIIGRDAETEEIANLLGSSGRSNILITGDPGSGKSSIVKAIASKIYHGTKYKDLRFKRVIEVNVGTLLAGTKSIGDVSQKLKDTMEEVEGSGDIILFLDEIHNLVIASSNGDGVDTNVFTVLEPYLASGSFDVIGATTVQNYRKYIEPNGSFARLFQMIQIEPTNIEDTFEILKLRSWELENEHGVPITYPAIENTIRLSNKLIHERVFPDKAIDVLGRTCAQVSKKNEIVESGDVANTVANLTNIPVASIKEGESQKLLHIEKDMKQFVIGQNEAIDHVGKALKRARVGIRNEDKPIASFLFVGTTGVGKTETAKTLAKVYFGDKKAMIRLDMSEYQQPDSINRLIGTPDGKTPGLLTDAVRTSPFALILLDEIEKAYSQVLLTFLQVLDDGRLTDSTGRVIDFTNTIIIATSNVGTRSIQEVAQKNGKFEEMREAGMADVRANFAPEFLNRFNGVIVFKPLDMDDVRKIARLMLKRVQEMADAKGIAVTFKPQLITQLVKRGYNPQWGARPLARVIEDSVETYLAEKILEGKFRKGDEVELGEEVFE